MRWVLLFPFTFDIWGSEGLQSYPQVTGHVRGGVRIWPQLYLIPSLSQGSVLLGPWILLGNRERDESRIWSWGPECYTKEHWWFFISSGKQLTIGSGGGLNALGWFLFESEMLVRHHSTCSSGDAHRGRDLGLEKQILEAFLLWSVLKFWECLCFLRERRLNEDSLTLGEKLTVKAHESE